MPGLPDEPTMSDTTVLMTVEDLINRAMGPPDANVVNFKLVQTILHILARQQRMLTQRVEIKVIEIKKGGKRKAGQDSTEGTTETSEERSSGQDTTSKSPHREPARLKTEYKKTVETTYKTKQMHMVVNKIEEEEEEDKKGKRQRISGIMTHEEKKRWEKDEEIGRRAPDNISQKDKNVEGKRDHRDLKKNSQKEREISDKEEKMRARDTEKITQRETETEEEGDLQDPEKMFHKEKEIPDKEEKLGKRDTEKMIPKESKKEDEKRSPQDSEKLPKEEKETGHFGPEKMSPIRELDTQTERNKDEKKMGKQNTEKITEDRVTEKEKWSPQDPSPRDKKLSQKEKRKEVFGNQDSKKITQRDNEKSEQKRTYRDSEKRDVWEEDEKIRQQGPEKMLKQEMETWEETKLEDGVPVKMTKEAWERWIKEDETDYGVSKITSQKEKVKVKKQVPKDLEKKPQKKSEQWKEEEKLRQRDPENMTIEEREEWEDEKKGRWEAEKNSQKDSDEMTKREKERWEKDGRIERQDLEIITLKEREIRERDEKILQKDPEKMTEQENRKWKEETMDSLKTDKITQKERESWENEGKVGQKDHEKMTQQDGENWEEIENMGQRKTDKVTQEDRETWKRQQKIEQTDFEVMTKQERERWEEEKLEKQNSEKMLQEREISEKMEKTGLEEKETWDKEERLAQQYEKAIEQESERRQLEEKIKQRDFKMTKNEREKWEEETKEQRDPENETQKESKTWVKEENIKQRDSEKVTKFETEKRQGQEKTIHTDSEKNTQKEKEKDTIAGQKEFEKKSPKETEKVKVEQKDQKKMMKQETDKTEIIHERKKGDKEEKMRHQETEKISHKDREIKEGQHSQKEERKKDDKFLHKKRHPGEEMTEAKDHDKKHRKEKGPSEKEVIHEQEYKDKQKTGMEQFPKKSVKEQELDEKGTAGRRSIEITEKIVDNEKILVVKSGPATRIDSRSSDSIDVVTLSQFALLEEAVRQLRSVVAPPPLQLPANKQLLSDVMKGTATLPDTMQALQVDAKLRAAESAVARMAGLLTQLAAAGDLPAQLQDQLEAIEKLTVPASEPSAPVERPRSVVPKKSVAIDPRVPSQKESLMGEGEAYIAESPELSLTTRPSAMSRASKMSSGSAAAAVPCVTYDEMKAALTDLRNDIMKCLNAMTVKAATSAENALHYANGVANKLDIALKVDERLSALYSLVEDYSEQLNGFEAGLATQTQSFQDQMIQMRLDLKAGLAQLENINNNAETSAVLELTERFDELATQMDSTLYAHKALSELQMRLSSEMRNLVECIEMLREQKADRDEVLDGLRDKADTSKLAGLLTEAEFKEAREDFERRIDLCHDKFSRQDAVWQAAIKDLKAATDKKAELMELLSARDEAQRQLRQLNDKIGVLAAVLGEPKAALVTRELAQGATCGACHARALMEPRDAAAGEPRALPALRPPPAAAPELPCIADWVAAAPPEERHICRRWCGGSHTLVSESTRRAQAQPEPHQTNARKFVDYGDDGRLYMMEEECMPCIECNFVRDEQTLETLTGHHGAGDMSPGREPRKEAP